MRWTRILFYGGGVAVGILAIARLASALLGATDVITARIELGLVLAVLVFWRGAVLHSRNKPMSAAPSLNQGGK
jgi:uncharacterized membrane protein